MGCTKCKTSFQEIVVRACVSDFLHTQWEKRAFFLLVWQIFLRSKKQTTKQAERRSIRRRTITTLCLTFSAVSENVRQRLVQFLNGQHLSTRTVSGCAFLGFPISLKIF